MSGVLMGHPTLNANSRHAAAALAQAGLLREFHTSIDTTAFVRALPHRVRESLARRALPQSVHEVAKAHPAAEVVRLLRRQLRLDHPSIYGPDVTAHAIDSATSRRLLNGASVVYCYEDAAARTFEAASRLGIPRIYDLPIGHWRAAARVYAAEAAWNPEWASTLTGPNLRNQAARTARKDRELELATHVVVASQFTAKTLEDSGVVVPVSIIGYGAPEVGPSRAAANTGVLKLLFVGSLTQRKGISYMFDAIGRLGNAVTLTVVGRAPTARNSALEQAMSSSAVTWIPSLPHRRLLEMMRAHDLLIFPSLFEGYGLVITEAMSQGLPVVTTTSTAGPEFINSGDNGWIVPPASADAIEEVVDTVLRDREWITFASRNAQHTARGLTWNRYGDAIVQLVERLSE